MHAKIQKIPPPEPPAPRVWTSLDLIKWTTSYFDKKGIASPRLEAELLLADVLDCPRIRLYVDFEKAVPPEKLATYREFVKRRAEAREPLQYILGHSQFIDLWLKVSPAVLIPRPETEILALWAVERLKERVPPPSPPPPPPADATAQTETPVPPQSSAPLPPSLHALDLCTGSGCLALYMASKVPQASVIATDISAAALALAAENAATLKLAERVVFRQGDLFGALQAEEKGTFDVAVANPPYVDPAVSATLAPEVRDHEPREALYSEGGGLGLVRRILAEAGEWLRPGGWLGMELGQGQADEVRRLAEDAGCYSGVEIREDHAKLLRYVLAQRTP